MAKLKRIWNIVTWVLVSLVVVAAVFLMGTRLMGYRVFNIVSGSMRPLYNVGDLIYVKDTDPADVQVGDVITVCFGNRPVSVRVVSIDEPRGKDVAREMYEIIDEGKPLAVHHETEA